MKTKDFKTMFPLLALLAASQLGAQTGAVTGTLKDQSDAAASGVTISAVNVTSGTRYESATDSQGEFRIGPLPPGSYTGRAERQGTRVEFKFDIGPEGQTVDVGAQVLTTGAQPQPIQPVHEEVTVTARRVEEEAQSVPIPLTVVNGQMVERSGAFNVNRLKELIPTVQFYSSNPRNTAVNIRGLGSPFGLTNDGIEPGVGFYVDGVFYARPAAGTLDFIDLERIEVLRGPQGTLFGKNTTAGAINITTRRPSFTPETNLEISLGNIGFLQAKGSITGPLGKKVAGRLSFSGTQRDGMLKNAKTGDDVNNLSNQGIRGSLLFIPTDKLVILASADYTRQRPRGYAQVAAGVAPTLRPLNRQWGQIASELGYAPPSYNAFDRLTDTDTPWRSHQDMGGASVTLDWNRGPGMLTAITAWRYWDWRPSNDRDFIGLPVTTISAAPSKQAQWTQEIRYAATVSSRVNFVAGFFVFRQTLKPSPFHKQEQGSAAARFLLAPSAQAATPGLLDGYGQNINFDFKNVSAAAFSNVELAVTNRWKITPGLRFNYDQKKLDYDQQVYGGLQTTNAALIALQRSILSPLVYNANVKDNNLSGQITVAYKAAENVNAYATYATGFKSVGLNLGGVPTDAAGNPIVSAATVRPEDVRNFEIGLKTRPLPGVTANIAAFNTGTKDFQTQVVNAQVGVLRGYLANAAKVRVRGIEFDGNAKLNDNFSVYSAIAFTDGRYISFADAPPPLEDTGGPQVKDVSGSILPGISKWAGSIGGEYVLPKNLFGRAGEYFAGIDGSFRTAFSSSPSASRYMVADGYGLLNARIGYRSANGWQISAWGRNLTGSNYFELLSAAPGNSGLYVGLPGDRRTLGVTLRRTFSEKNQPIAPPSRPRSAKKDPAAVEVASRQEF
jgi:iron complex outermembrane receptor protein